MKGGDRAATKIADIPMGNYEKITLRERTARNNRLHPNDKNVPRENMGEVWKPQSKHCKLNDFYKSHIYTFIDGNDISKKGWVRIAGNKEEEE